MSLGLRLLHVASILSSVLGISLRRNLFAHNVDSLGAQSKKKGLSPKSAAELRCYLKHQMKAVLPQSINPLGHTTALPRWKTCAVVSNSGALLKHNYGADIDAADAVFRFNDAPTLGFESHVGSRETVRFGNSRIPVDLWLGNMPLVKTTKYVLLFEGLPDGYQNILIRRFPNGHFYETQKRLYDEAESTLLKLYNSSWREHIVHGESTDPTTGCVGMLTAMFLCSRVEAFEFAPSAIAAESPYNYYEHHKTRATNSTEHSMFEAEHDLWRSLSTSSADEINRLGRAMFPGFSEIDCPS